MGLFLRELRLESFNYGIDGGIATLARARPDYVVSAYDVSTGRKVPYYRAIEGLREYPQPRADTRRSIRSVAIQRGHA